MIFVRFLLEESVVQYSWILLVNTLLIFISGLMNVIFKYYFL